MSVLEDPRRIGDNNTESVEPRSKVVVVFFGRNIHGLAAISVTSPRVSIEWIGLSLWWGGTAFNAPAPVFHIMRPVSLVEWHYTFRMIGYKGIKPSGARFLCVEAAVSFEEFVHWRMRYCIPPQPTDPKGPGLARRRFPRRRLVPTPDTTGLARASCKR